MFFDLKFYSYAKPGRALVADIRCVVSSEVSNVMYMVDNIDHFDIMLASRAFTRDVELTSDEAIEVITEDLP